MLLNQLVLSGMAVASMRDQIGMESYDSAPLDAHATASDTNLETTIIVGGGSIGLNTAYHLALLAKASEQPRRIVVVEIFNETFAAASGQNTGCLHHEFREDEGPILEPLGKYSFQLWGERAEDADFRAAVGYRAHNFFELNPGSGFGLEKLPDWLQYDPSWDVDESVLSSPSAMVNPMEVGKWITSECLRLGVEIRTNNRVISAALSSSGRVQSVDLNTAGTTSTLHCTSLVLAAGPWTPDLYHQLFPASTVDLKGVSVGGDWILFRNPYRIIEMSNAFVALDGIVEEKLEVVGRQDGTIWLIGRKDGKATLSAPGTNASPNETMIDELLGRARAYLREPARKDSVTHKDCAPFPILSTGRGIRPGRTSLLPIISQVPGPMISTDNVRSEASGVFINWGHGSYGLTLGMGSGKVMSQLICGQEPDVDLRPFTLTSAH